MGVATGPYDNPREDVAVMELSAALTGLQPLLVDPDQNYCAIQCGAGIELAFDIKVSCSSVDLVNGSTLNRSRF